MKKLFSQIALAAVLALTGCGQTEIVIQLGDHNIEYTADEFKYLSAAEAPVALKKYPMPDFGKYSIKCVTEETYDPQVPELEFHSRTEGNILCYTVCKGIAYFVVSFDDYHEFSHIIKLFRYEPESGSTDIPYTFESADSSMLVTDIYVNDSDIFLAAMKNDNTEEYFIERIDPVAKNTETIYTSRKKLRFFQDSDIPAWYELSSSCAEIKYYDDYDGEVYGGGEYYGFRRSLPYETKTLSYGMHKDGTGCVYADISDNGSRLRMNTDKEYWDLRYASANLSYWLSWAAENSYGDPYLYCYNARTDTLYNFPTSEMGVFFSDCCVNGKYFLHLIRDNISGSGNDFFENVYYIDVENKTAYNLTENTTGSNDSLIRTEFEYLYSKKNIMYFYSRHNDNETNAEYKYEYLYLCEVT